MKNYRKYTILLFLGISLIFTSCLGMEAEISINDTGAGTLKMEYRVSQFAANFGRVDNEHKLLALPISRQDFEQAVSQIPGLALTAYSRKDTETETVVSADLTFTNIDSLSRFFSSQDIRQPVLIENIGTGSALRFFIFQGVPEKPSEEILELYKTVFQENSIRISCVLPRRIQSSSAGTISQDGRRITLDLPLFEIIQTQEPVIWEILY